jgi:HEAT repeat protein
MASPLEIATDRSRPPADRIRAIEEATQRVAGEHVQARAQVWGPIFQIYLDDGEPEEIRTAAARAGRNVGVVAINNLVAHATPGHPRLRLAATETLAAIAQQPLEDVHEQRLQGSLAELQGELGGSYHFVNLALAHGADPRGVAVLQRGVASADAGVRRSAIAQLCSLGQMAAAVAAATGDPDPYVRAGAVQSLGFYWTGGDDVVSALTAALADADPQVAKEARTALRRQKLQPVPRPGRPASGKTVEVDARFPWREFLNRWSAQWLTVPEFVAGVDDEVIAAGFLGREPAGDGRIADLERRLGRPLPPSYGSFLRTTDGFMAAGPSVSRILAAEDVRPFSEAEPEWIDIWTRDGFSLSPEEHRSGRDNEGAHWEYLWDCIQVSEALDSSVYLLCPSVTDEHGEWEAWLFASWIPGARRYASWWELLQAEHRVFEEVVLKTHAGA